MLRPVVLSLINLLLVAACASAPTPGEMVRIDATSEATAATSYSAMMKGRSLTDQQKLAVAVLKLNLEGANSAYDVARNPELQNPTIGRIKDKVAGLTADQIIELADRTSSLRIEVSGQ